MRSYIRNFELVDSIAEIRFNRHLIKRGISHSSSRQKCQARRDHKYREQSALWSLVPLDSDFKLRETCRR